MHANKQLVRTGPYTEVLPLLLTYYQYIYIIAICPYVHSKVCQLLKACLYKAIFSDLYILLSFCSAEQSLNTGIFIRKQIVKFH